MWLVITTRERVANPERVAKEYVGPFANLSDAFRYGEAWSALWREENGSFQVEGLDEPLPSLMARSTELAR